MILFINVYLEENAPSPLGQPNSRYNLKNYTKREIFLYTLESYKVIPWSHVFINCELHENVEDHQGVFRKINELYPNALVSHSRCIYQWHWQSCVEKILEYDDDLIWYAGNHDHPYIASNNKQLNLLIDALNNCHEQYKSAVYSHHPDTASWIMEDLFFNCKHESKGVCSYEISRAEGIMILNKNLLKSWWFDFNYGDARIPRADWIGISCSSPISKVFLPIKPLCQHFDGYTLSSYEYSAADSPPLEIPEGFWDNNIIIDYCGSERRPGHTLVNPFLPYKVIDENGADLRCMLDDLPLFWKNRISKINHYDKNYRKIRNARNKALYEGAAARRFELNKILQKGINISELLDYRPKLSLEYLKDLFI